MEWPQSDLTDLHLRANVLGNEDNVYNAFVKSLACCLYDKLLCLIRTRFASFGNVSSWFLPVTVHGGPENR